MELAVARAGKGEGTSTDKEDSGGKVKLGLVEVGKVERESDGRGKQERWSERMMEGRAGKGTRTTEMLQLLNTVFVNLSIFSDRSIYCMTYLIN